MLFQLNNRLYLNFTDFSTATLYLLHCQGETSHRMAHLQGRYAKQDKGFENELTGNLTPEKSQNLQT